MAKNRYIRPVLMDDITPEEPTTIDFGGSQGSSGDINQFIFQGIEEAIVDIILANCDYTDLAEMDTDGDLIITLDEYNAWYPEHAWW